MIEELRSLPLLLGVLLLNSVWLAVLFAIFERMRELEPTLHARLAPPLRVDPDFVTKGMRFIVWVAVGRYRCLSDVRLRRMCAFAQILLPINFIALAMLLCQS